MAEGLLERFLPVTIADGRASTTRRSIPTRAVWALARFWWAAWLKRFVRIGLPKVAVGVPADNDAGNDFWEHQGFAVRDDLVYRELPL